MLQPQQGAVVDPSKLATAFGTRGANNAPRGKSALAIITCPGCGRGDLRIPDGRRGTVTCPGCGAKWFYPETVEISDVDFRCSKSGARFTVTSSRRSPLHPFVVQEITKASIPRKHSRSPEPKPSQQPAGKAVVPSSWIATSKVSGWLARAVGRNIAIPSPLPKAVVPDEAKPVAAHDIKEHNWAGFSCPYCMASSFVQCGAGGHLACDGTVELRNGRRFHKCFCGGAGFITWTIEAIDGNRRVEPKLGAEQPPVSKNDGLRGGRPAIALPSPRKGGPPAKR